MLLFSFVCFFVLRADTPVFPLRPHLLAWPKSRQIYLYLSTRTNLQVTYSGQIRRWSESKIWDKNLGQKFGTKSGTEIWDRRTDRQTDRQTDKQTDGQTDKTRHRVALQLKSVICPKTAARKLQNTVENPVNCPQAVYQSRRKTTNRRPAKNSSSQSDRANSGHQSAVGSQGVRYSDVVSGNYNHHYTVPTQNKFAPLN